MHGWVDCLKYCIILSVKSLGVFSCFDLMSLSQEDLKTFPFKVTRSDDGGIVVNLDYEKDGCELEQKAFTPEQLLAMLLGNTYA